MPATQAALGLAPTAEKRRPIVVLRKKIDRTTTSAMATQTETLRPRNLDPPQSAKAGGTLDSWARACRYHKVAPVVIAPTASVTISAFSLKTPTRTPLISPTAVARRSAPTSAVMRPL